MVFTAEKVFEKTSQSLMSKSEEKRHFIFSTLNVAIPNYKKLQDFSNTSLQRSISFLKRLHLEHPHSWKNKF